jgi:hypothetical protein
MVSYSEVTTHKCVEAEFSGNYSNLELKQAKNTGCYRKKDLVIYTAHLIFEK